MNLGRRWTDDASTLTVRTHRVRLDRQGPPRPSRAPECGISQGDGTQLLPGAMEPVDDVAP